MPFTSQKQEKFMFSQHPEIAKKMAHNSGQTGGGTKKSKAAYHSLPAKAKSGGANRSAGTGKSGIQTRGASPVHRTSGHMAKAHAAGKAEARSVRARGR